MWFKCIISQREIKKSLKKKKIYLLTILLLPNIDFIFYIIILPKRGEYAHTKLP